LRFAVRLTPRGGLDRVERVEAGDLCVRVAAPPIDGAANVALVRLLASDLDVAPSAIRLISGATGRRKLVGVSGVGRDRLMARWPGLRL
jgi:uncharacterized protein YggU (UPF0235/DUF167 family)